MPRMIRLQWLLCLTVVGCVGGLSASLAVSSAAFADENPYEDVRLSRVSLIDGELLLQRGDDEEWTAASVNLPLRPHDRLWATDGARSEVQFDDGTVARLAENTNLDLLNLDNDLTQLQLTLGVATISTPAARRGAQEIPLELDTPQASLHLKPASSVRVDVAEDGSTVITVWDGEATINREEGPLTVAAHQRVAIEGGDSPRYELEPAPPVDEWDRWVDERTGQLAEAESRERLGPDSPVTGVMGEGALGMYGAWNQVPSYGWVWTPRVAVGWAPYQAGRWIWQEPWGWTWVSYESWGWLPYHYGRWLVVSPLGWVWIPGPTLGVWAPGCVRFIYGPDWVAWVPLGPGEVYYHRPPPPSVTVNVNLVNYRTRGAVTVWSRREFVNGVHGHDRYLPPKDPIHAGRVAFGPPPVVPDRASLRPLPAQKIRPAQLPPRVISRPVVYRHEPAPMPEPFDERVKRIHGTITKGHPPTGVEAGPVTRGQPKYEERRRPETETVYRGLTTYKKPPAAGSPSAEERRPEAAPGGGETNKPGRTRKSGQPSMPKQVEFGRPTGPAAAQGSRQIKPLYERPPQARPKTEAPKKTDKTDSDHSGAPNTLAPRSR